MQVRVERAEVESAECFQKGRAGPESGLAQRGERGIRAFRTPSPRISRPSHGLPLRGFAVGQIAGAPARSRLPGRACRLAHQRRLPARAPAAAAAVTQSKGTAPQSSGMRFRLNFRQYDAASPGTPPPPAARRHRSPLAAAARRALASANATSAAAAPGATIGTAIPNREAVGHAELRFLPASPRH